MLILHLENTELLPSFFFRKDLLADRFKKKKIQPTSLRCTKEVSFVFLDPIPLRSPTQSSQKHRIYSFPHWSWRARLKRNLWFGQRKEFSLQCQQYMLLYCTFSITCTFRRLKFIKCPDFLNDIGKGQTYKNGIFSHEGCWMTSKSCKNII